MNKMHFPKNTKVCITLYIMRDIYSTKSILSLCMFCISFFGEIKLLRIMAKCTYTIINYELMLNQFLLTKSGSDDSCMYQREKGTLQM